MKPQTIVLLTTGGTIAMRQQDTAEGAVPQLTATDLIDLLPHSQISDNLTVHTEAHCNLPSSHFTLDTLWSIRERVIHHLSSPTVDGIVITHGTDTLEETAYLLDLTVPGPKPIVLTGAMRTASDPGYDGPANLAAALQVAASPYAHNLGALVVLNNTIHAARFVTKTHTLAPDTFQSGEFGPLGRVDGNVLIPQRIERRIIPCNRLEPRVALLKLTIGQDDSLLRALIDQGIRGIVLEGLGGGRIPPWWLETLQSAIDQGITIAIASRCPWGRTWDAYGYPGAYHTLYEMGALFADGINGPKARIRLMAVLGTAQSPEEIRLLWQASAPLDRSHPKPQGHIADGDFPTQQT